MKHGYTTQQYFLTVTKAGILFTALFAAVFFLGCAVSSNQNTADNTAFDDAGEKGEKIFSFHEESGGNDNLWKAVFKNGELESLYRNGKKIPAERISKYKKLVYDNIEEIQDEGSQYYNFPFHSFNYNFNEKMKKMNRKLGELHLDSCCAGFDSEKFQKEMEELGDRLSRMKIEINFDTNKFGCDTPNFMKHHHFFNSDKFKHDMKNLSKEIESHTSVMHDFKVDMSGFEKGMDVFKENMKGFKFKMKDMEKEMKKLKAFIKDLKHELLKDGYIKEEDENFDMELNSKEMIINGKKLPDNLLKKYKEIYKKFFDKEITDDNNFHIHK